jgi:hypothetical protein
VTGKLGSEIVFVGEAVDAVTVTPNGLAIRPSCGAMPAASQSPFERLAICVACHAPITASNELAKRLDNGNRNRFTHLRCKPFLQASVHYSFPLCRVSMDTCSSTIARSFLPMKLLRITPEQRRVLELLAREPRGVTGHLLVIGHGFEMKMLAGLAQDELVAAVVGESVKAGDNATEVVRFWITVAGRRAIETRPITAL